VAAKRTSSPSKEQARLWKFAGRGLDPDAIPQIRRGNIYVYPDVATDPLPTRGPRQQLPPGRHGLSRSFVVHNQRERILSAVADVASAAGYAAMSVEDIIVVAGVSRRTFYDHFSNKEDAFLHAYDAVVAQLNEQVFKAWAARDTFVDRVRDGLAAFLDFVARDPAFADMCIVEALAAGPEALERRDGTLKAFAALFDRAASELIDQHQPSPLVSETIVGGIYQVVYARVLRGEVPGLPALLPDLVYSALLPYLGHEAARREYDSLLQSQERATRRAS
jgi:AcrR family transcriptional regulator